MPFAEAALAADVARALRNHSMPFMLVGAAALAVRGLTRGTHDIDFLTTNPSVLDIEWSAELPDGTTVEVRTGDHDDPLAGVVRFSRVGSADVDLVVGRWRWQKAMIDRSEVTSLGSFSAPVPAVSDLVLLKIDAGSFLDERDAAQLIEIHGAEVIAEVDARVGEAPALSRAWERLKLEIASGA